MKEQTAEVVKAAKRREDFSYISEVIQRSHIRPSTYVHEIGLPYDVYEAMSNMGWINHESYFRTKQAFFEFKSTEVVVSFMHLYSCEDFHHLIDRFIIHSLTGSYPVRRSGISKMNFDVKKEYVVFKK